MANPLPPEALAAEESREAAMVRALEAQLAAQRHDPATGVAVAEQVMAAVDGLVRARWGLWPWVHRTTPGTVERVDAPTHRTRTRVASAGAGPAAAQTVKYGFGRPTVGRQYPVEFPVRLPDAPTPLITGPVPAGDPWLKAPGGQVWLYYRTFEDAAQFALYRVPLPPANTPGFAYTNADALRIHTLPAVLGSGNLNLGAGTLHGEYFWLDEHSFERFSRPELAPAGYPGNTRLHRYDHFGVDQTETLLDTNPVHILAHGSNRATTERDELLGSAWYSVAVTPPAGWPFGSGPYYDVVLDLVLSNGGALWTTTRTGLVVRRHVFVKNASGDFFTDQIVAGETQTPLDATGWLGEGTLGGWWSDGQRVQLWALTTWANGDPYPADRIIVSPAPDPTADNPVKVLLYVSADGAPAVAHPLTQPAGWVQAFMLRPTGGATARAWWLGSATNGGTPQLWRGDGTLGGAWTWAVQDGGLGLNALRAVSADGSVVLAGINTGAPHFDEARYLSQDAGATWAALPTLPQTAGLGAQGPQAWLVDTP